MEEMNRVTVMKGRVIFDFINRLNPLGWLRYVMTRLPGSIYLRAYTHHSIERLCKQIGFELKGFHPVQLFVDAANVR
ncbi:transposase domain-containing protein, partial [Thermodesulfobacteriota bacterium]